MKVINSLQGTVVLRANHDEISPQQGLIQKDFIEFIAARYQFAIKPIIPPQAPQEMFPNLMFRNGKFLINSISTAVHQIIEFPNGDAVTATNTDIAEKILGDLVKGLSEILGFRYEGAKQHKSYSSSLVVKFEKGLEERIPAFRKIDEILRREIPREDRPFKPKAFAFGSGDLVPAQIMGDVNALEKTDFTLQRRNGVPYSENIYFSNMPLANDAHARVLQTIEDSL